MPDTKTSKEKPVSEAAKRALAEAQARRDATPKPATPPELGGRDGPEPTRFGDWEKNGIASDF
jgi:hypothetical protein